MSDAQRNSPYRFMTLSSFPVEAESGAQARDPFEPENALGGFLVAPENRLAELAYRLVVEGTPIFDRAIGDRSLDATRAESRVPTRADLEILLTAARETTEPLDRFFPNSENRALFNPTVFNAARVSPDAPAIVGYRAFEEVGFLTPLVFYGPSGVGKTRLIQSACQRRRESAPNKTLYYLTATEFSRALTDAIRRDQTQLFRSLFAQARVIAIENCDVLAEKETTQLEFLPLLDDAIRARKLVVLSFSKRPEEIRGLLPDLLARVGAGLVVPVELPTDETKRFVAETLLRKLGLPFDAESLSRLTEALPSTIPTLCASLTQAAREFAIARERPTIARLEERVSARPRERVWTVDQVVKEVAKGLSVSVVALRGRGRSKSLAFARKCAIFFARRLTNATNEEIGRATSRRDHSTISTLAAEIERAYATDDETRAIIRDLANKLDVARRL